jgi:hypothetical protein
MSDKLANGILEVGMGLIMAGTHQPPPREGAMRVLHSHGHLKGVVCVEETCG